MSVRHAEFYQSLLRQAGGTWFDFEGLIRDIYVTLLKPGDIAVDAGAHKGVHTFQMARAVAPGGRVIAVEAAPLLIQELMGVCRREYHDLADVIDFRGIGLSDHHGTARFYFSPETPGLSGLRSRTNLVGGPLVESEVNLAPLDFICQKRPRPVRFIKVDIEGGEFDALRGAKETIGHDRPVIAFEHNTESPSYFSYSIEDLLGLFDSLDYDLYDFFGTSYNDAADWEGTMMWNFLAMPKGSADRNRVFGAVRNTLSGIGIVY